MKNFFKIIRVKLTAGLITIAPVALTFIILKWIFNIIAGFTEPLLLKIPLNFPPYAVTFMAFFLTLFSVLLLGILVTNILGKQLLQWGESLLQRIPIVSSIYKPAKQIVLAFSGDTNQAFKKPIYMQFPREGIWSLGFVTGESRGKNGTEYYHVFYPTTPNPTSGYMLIIPKKDAYAATMSVEESMKMIISGGMVTPKTLNIPENKNPVQEANVGL